MVWFILIPFTIKEILGKKNYIKENFFAIGIMGILSISTFNSVVYFALNFTQVINAVLMLAAIPPMIIIFSSIMKIEKTNIFQISGLFLSIIGVGTIISNADIQKIISSMNIMYPSVDKTELIPEKMKNLIKPKEIDYNLFLESEPLIETWLETIAG